MHILRKSEENQAILTVWPVGSSRLVAGQMAWHDPHFLYQTTFLPSSAQGPTQQQDRGQISYRTGAKSAIRHGPTQLQDRGQLSHRTGANTVVGQGPPQQQDRGHLYYMIGANSAIQERKQLNRRRGTNLISYSTGAYLIDVAQGPTQHQDEGTTLS